MSSYFDDLPALPQPPLTIAISECLVGGEVRHDGGHKRSSLPHDKLEGLFAFQPVCPEVGIGLGVPRDAIRLVGDIDTPRAVGARDSTFDVTAQLTEFANLQLPRLNDVDGHIFTKNSPSCSGSKSTAVKTCHLTPKAEAFMQLRSLVRDLICQWKRMVDCSTRFCGKILSRERLSTRIGGRYWRKASPPKH